MAKRWVLDTDTKGTGARVVPLEQLEKERALTERPAKPRRRRRAQSSQSPRRAPRPPARTEKRSPTLAPGIVRKKTTGELGRVQSVDPKAGTATVLWMRGGRTSTVPLSAISRR